MKNNKSYSLGIQLPENTYYFNDLYFSLKHDLKTQNIEVHFAPCAFMKLKLDNVNCFDEDDTIKLYHDGSDAGYNG